MAIDILNPNHRSKLHKAVRYAHTRGAVTRTRRNSLIRIHNEEDDVLGAGSPQGDTREMGAFVNYFQQFVRGQVLSLAYQNPKWSVKARTASGRGFDKRIELMLGKYFDVLDFTAILRQWAVDTAFGNAIAKVVNGIAPKGVNSPYAPRVYRIHPNDFIVDIAADSIREASYFADMYLVPLTEARNYPGFNPTVAQSLTPFLSQDHDGRANIDNHHEAFSEEMVRLIDIYLPTSGAIATFPCNNDSFGEMLGEPLSVRPTTINPYEVCQLLYRPDSTQELSRLWSLREPHFLANDMWHKTARQARQARRNPVDKMGNSDDLSNIQNARDGEAVFLNDPSHLDLYTLPGPDPALVQSAMLSAQTFSQQAGNLEVALGIDPGAETARQTQAMMGQISSAQAYDRSLFERFVSNIGKKVATLAFESDVLQLEVVDKVPGTPFVYNRDWAPPQMLPRVGVIDDYRFDVVAYSTGYRSPQERLTQLNEASLGILQWMTAAANGAPIELRAVIKSFQEAYDQIDLLDWWSGEKPSPQQRTVDTYTSTAAPSQGSDIRYQGASDSSDNILVSENPMLGGLSGGLGRGG